MRSILFACTVVAVTLGVTGRASADNKAEIVSTVPVWDGANFVTEPDLIHFGDRWFLACQESAVVGWPGGTVRVLTSADGKAWESAARIESPTANRGLFAPKFNLVPDGQLTITATGFIGHPNPTDPVTGSGGTLKTMAWVSKDGRAWGKPELIGSNDFPLGRVVWHNGTAYSHAIGRICGSIKTVHIVTSPDGKTFANLAEEYLEKTLPYEGEMLFRGDTAYCLMTGGYSKALLGTATAPYKAWTWKLLDQPIRHPNFLRLPNKRILATVGLFDGTTRTSLCAYDLATGRFTELLELPAGKQAVPTGLAWHDGHVWVCYPVVKGEKQSVQLAKVKLN